MDANRKEEEDDGGIDSYKVVLVGDAGVGKTYLMNTYVRGQAPRNNLPTIGIEFASKTVTLPDGGKVKAQIWDTAGQDRYRQITKTHFKSAGGAIVVYDITKDKTFENLNKWLEDLKEEADPDLVIYIIGNKLDLVEKNPSTRKVSIENGQSLSKEFKALFEETSALKGVVVVNCFDKLIQEMYLARNKYGGKSQTGIKLESEQKQISGCGICKQKCFG